MARFKNLGGHEQKNYKWNLEIPKSQKVKFRKTDFLNKILGKSFGILEMPVSVRNFL